MCSIVFVVHVVPICEYILFTLFVDDELYYCRLCACHPFSESIESVPWMMCQMSVSLCLKIC